MQKRNMSSHFSTQTEGINMLILQWNKNLYSWTVSKDGFAWLSENGIWGNWRKERIRSEMQQVPRK